MKISILTLFPEMFSGPLSESIIKRAIERNLVSINLVQIRDYGLGKHKIVDDTPYGGGSGMILRVDVLSHALKATQDTKLTKDEEKVILMTADGEVYDQIRAKSYTKLKHLIIICGHYEGVDERIRSYIDEEVSIGDFVLTGGEIPAMTITDSIVRLLPGVLKDGVTDNESHSLSINDSSVLEYPQYTRPSEFDGQKVPDILISGNHRKINEWKNQQALQKTKKLRPDLIKTD